MDDTRLTDSRQSDEHRTSPDLESSRRFLGAAGRRLFCLTGVFAFTGSLAGCSLFVMAGKMLLGDPTMPSAFRSAVGVDLTKGKKKVLVVCSTPEAIKSDFPTVKYDLVNGVTRRLKLRGIDTVNPDHVATWMDDNGGEWNSSTELARQFETDYIIHMDMDQLSYREENSPNLFRGRALGNIFVYEVHKVGGQKQAVEVFVREFASVHPINHPVSAELYSDKVFSKMYLDRICTQISQMFYDYRLSEEM